VAKERDKEKNVLEIAVVMALYYDA